MSWIRLGRVRASRQDEKNHAKFTPCNDYFELCVTEVAGQAHYAITDGRDYYAVVSRHEPDSKKEMLSFCLIQVGDTRYRIILPNYV